MVIDAAVNESAPSTALHHTDLVSGATQEPGAIGSSDCLRAFRFAAVRIPAERRGVGAGDRESASARERAFNINQGGAIQFFEHWSSQSEAGFDSSGRPQVGQGSGPTARRRKDAAITTVQPLGRFAASDILELTKGAREAMGAELTMDGLVDHRIMDARLAVWRATNDGRYQQDPLITALATATIALADDAGYLSQDVALVRSLFGGSRGHRSPRFVRRLKEIWRRENVTFLGFVGETNEEPTGAARAA